MDTTACKTTYEWQILVDYFFVDPTWPWKIRKFHPHEKYLQYGIFTHQDAVHLGAMSSSCILVSVVVHHPVNETFVHQQAWESSQNLLTESVFL